MRQFRLKLLPFFEFCFWVVLDLIALLFLLFDFSVITFCILRRTRSRRSSSTLAVIVITRYKAFGHKYNILWFWCVEAFLGFNVVHKMWMWLFNLMLLIPLGDSLVSPTSLFMILLQLIKAYPASSFLWFIFLCCVHEIYMNACRASLWK